MNDKDLVAQLRGLMVETGSLACLGCGHEHNCSLHGCAILREAADRLERVGWISVEEWLPDTFTSVIVCRPGGKAEAGMRDLNGWWKVYGTRTKQVTHWMPMPAAPQEGGNAHDG